jgi:hypothetical protein
MRAQDQNGNAAFLEGGDCNGEGVIDWSRSCGLHLRQVNERNGDISPTTIAYDSFLTDSIT